MRVKKSFLILGIVLLVLVGIPVLFFTINSVQKASFNCDEFKDRIPSSDCGYSSSSLDNQYHKVIGIIDKKYISDKEYILALKVKDSHDKKVILTTRIAPDPLPKSVTKLTSPELMLPETPIDLTEKYDAKTIYDKLHENQNIIITIFIPKESSQQVKLAREKFGNLKIFDCVDHSNSVVNYLKNSNILTYTKMLRSKMATNCDVYISNIQIK